MIQLGIAAFYHDAAACIVKDGTVIAACEEERWTEIKHDMSFPAKSITWCLTDAGLTMDDVDEVCWYENPEKKKDRVLTIFKKRPIRTFFTKKRFLKEFEENNPVRLLADLGYHGEIKYIDHHLSHAAFSYLTSPYKDAAILTVDGVGEWETVGIYYGKGDTINQKLTINFPNSLGMLYSTITAYLGFKPNEGEYKVMGLAPYGDPSKYFAKLDKIFSHTSNKFWIDQKYFPWEYTDKIMFNNKFCQLLDLQPRLPEEPLEQAHKDLAAALQKIYEREFLRLVKRAKDITGSQNLCLGGGCAYNGVANNFAYKYFDSIHIPWAPSDAGSAIGACLYHYEGKRKVNTSPYLGPAFTNDQVRTILYSFRDKVNFYELTDAKLKKNVAEFIAADKIVAWFQGRMEFGARSLGNRAILANATTADMRELLNRAIKKRESFRPFAPSICEDDMNKYFQLREAVPYMNQVCQAKPAGRTTKHYPLPAATHVDGTARAQTVTKKQNKRYYDLIKEVGRVTGHPVVLNTSFNLKDQVITKDPVQAVLRYLSSEIDYLVIENFLIEKK